LIAAKKWRLLSDHRKVDELLKSRATPVTDSSSASWLANTSVIDHLVAQSCGSPMSRVGFAGLALAVADEL
jgi:hypothetical protein